MNPSSIALVTLAFGAALPLGSALAPSATAAPRTTVVDVAAGDARFSTLVAAVKAADLVETLSGPGPFTVLAPTNDAFRALPAGTLETLLKKENVGQLAAILTYHVLPGRVTAAELARGLPQRTVLGTPVSARFDAGRLTIAGAPIVATDLEAGNGLVHVLGAVLLPPKPATSTGRLPQVVSVVDRALELGVPLYNHGNHAACAAAYAVAAHAVATLAGGELPADLRTALLEASSASGSDMDRAWALRRVLDLARKHATSPAAVPATPAAVRMSDARPAAVPAATAPSPAPAARVVPASATPDRLGAAAALDRAASSRDDAATEGHVLDAVARLGAGSRAATRLRAEPDTAARRRLASELRDDLRFEPLLEAESPAGWPSPTVIGEVEIKRYPAYRMAKADGAGNAGFWTLFRHIKANDIAMTAPVQMDYERTDGSSSGAMGFLYGRTDLGRAGRDGDVEIVDVAPSVVASIGVRGPLSTRAMDEARDALTAWLASHPEWTATAPVRSMGWNSPFVERGRQYFEVQVPVAARASAAAR